jgi:hypothetical protein
MAHPSALPGCDIFHNYEYLRQFRRKSIILFHGTPSIGSIRAAYRNKSATNPMVLGDEVAGEISFTK